MAFPDLPSLGALRVPRLRLDRVRPRGTPLPRLPCGNPGQLPRLQPPGYNHPRMVRVLVEQGQRMIHCSNLFYHPFQGTLARRLAELSGMSRVFFTNSGTEAIEAALKISRAYARSQGHAEKSLILAM